MPKVVRNPRYRFALRPRNPPPVLIPVNLPDNLLNDNGVIQVDDVFIETPYFHFAQLFDQQPPLPTPRSRAQRAKDQRHRRAHRRFTMAAEIAKSLQETFKDVPKLEAKNGESNFSVWGDYVRLAASVVAADKYLTVGLAATADDKETTKHDTLLRCILFKLPIEVFTRFSKVTKVKDVWAGLTATYAVHAETTKAVTI